MAYLRQSRSLTSLGEEQYNELVEHHLHGLRKCQRDIDTLLSDIDEDPVMDLGIASHVKQELTRRMDRYNSLAEDYEAFLQSHRTQESQSARISFQMTLSTLRTKVSVALRHLDTLLPKPERSTSSIGNRSRSSKATEHSQSELLRQTVKLETAKAKLKYAQEEAELLKKEAALKAERNVLTIKKEVAEAESGIAAVKQTLQFDTFSAGGSYKPPRSRVSSLNHDDTDLNSDYEHDKPSVLLTDTEKRTANYVKEQSDRHSSRQTEYNSDKNSGLELPAQINLNPYAQPFRPVQDIAKFMVKKDLITSRLTPFDDQPARYLSWKMSFKQIMLELDATPLEQLDLLIKYLGPISQQQARNIRSANANYPATAVRLNWDRLENRYGTPEMIESSIQLRLRTFPKLSNHQRKELYDLADLAAEIEAIKKDEKCRATFGYFDASLGVNRFVSKLPYSIQEKWTTSANNYKVNNNVVYPPFSHFVTFLQNIAKVRNDPGFMYEDQDSKHSSSKEQLKPRRNQIASTLKTNVSQRSYNKKTTKTMRSLL